jgi:hypothetical protein
MKKIDIKTKETYSKDEMKRYLGALHEDYKGKLDVVVEGINIIKKKQDQHTEMLGRHEKILNLHTEMIGNIMEDVSVLKDDMQIVKKELKKKVDYDEFLSLVQRVNKLEAKN